MAQKITLDEVWPPLEDGLTHLLTKLTEGFSMQAYMKLYRFCPILSPWPCLSAHSMPRHLLHPCPSPCLPGVSHSLRSDVYNYCTTTRPAAANRGKPQASGANFAGEDLYYRLQNFLQKHVKNVFKVRCALCSSSCHLLTGFFVECTDSNGRFAVEFLQEGVGPIHNGEQSYQ